MELIGHHRIRSSLDKCLEKGVLCHAFLFSGPQSVGKFMLAETLAEKLAGKNGRSSGDVMVVAPGIKEQKGVVSKTDIRIESIRSVQKHLSQTAFGGGSKVVIIDEADRMTRASQNALLKTLEEPSANSYIILVTSDVSKLLPTILSRVEHKKFSALKDEEMVLLIDDGKKRNELLFWSMGRPGLLKRLLDDNSELERRRESLSGLNKIVAATADEKMSVAEAWSKNIPETLEKLSWWSLLLRSCYGGGPIQPAVPVVLAISAQEKIEKATADLKGTNASSRLILENLLLSFET